jgi:hypothetical protein
MTICVVSLAAFLAPSALALGLVLGCGASAEERSLDPDSLLDDLQASEVVFPGSLSIELSYAKAETGAAVVSVWPLASEAGRVCPFDCAQQLALCPPDCQAVAIGTNDTASWPGTNVVLIGDLEPRSYWVSAYLMRGAEHRDGPWPRDPVSRQSPLRMEIVSEQKARAAFSLDAVRVDARIQQSARCLAPVAGEFERLEVDERASPDCSSDLR